MTATQGGDNLGVKSVKCNIYFFEYLLLYSWAWIRQTETEGMVMMTKEGSTKLVNLMASRAGVLCYDVCMCVWGGGGKRERVKIMHNFDDMYQHIVCFALTFFRFMPYFDTPVSFYWFRLRPFQTLKTQLIRVNVFHLCHVLYKTWFVIHWIFQIYHSNISTYIRSE